MNSLNAYIDDACKDALVDIMSGSLLHRHGGTAMELYLANPGDAKDETLNDLVERTVERRALPLADRMPTKPKRNRRIALGPKKTSAGTLRRIVLPMYTWDQERVAPLLSEICPREEHQIDKSIPGLILSCLVKMPNVITFDENDVVERLQPKLQAKYFPWQDNFEWQQFLATHQYQSCTWMSYTRPSEETNWPLNRKSERTPIYPTKDLGHDP